MDLITAVSYAIAEQDIRLTPKQALFRHYCRYGDSKTLRHLALTLGDDLFTSTAVDMYFDTVYTHGTLDIIRTLHELIPGRHHLEAPISNPNDNVVELYGPRCLEGCIKSLNISRLFRLFPNYKTYTEQDERTGYLEVEIDLICDLRYQRYFKPAITQQQVDTLVKQGWKLIPYIVHDAVKGKIKLSRLLELAVVMYVMKGGCIYEIVRKWAQRLSLEEKLFYVIGIVDFELIVNIYGKDAVINLIRNFPVVKIVNRIVRYYSLIISRCMLDVIDFFADKLVGSPYANLLALVTTKPELYLSSLRPCEYYFSVSLDLADRLWDNLRFYVKRRPETVVEIFERTQSTIVRSYAFQLLWLEGIKVDDSKLNYYTLDLKSLKVKDEYIINVFLRDRNEEELMQDLYFAWKRINPYIIDYILRTKGITREQIIQYHEEQ
jgi:hypothetical protein